MTLRKRLEQILAQEVERTFGVSLPVLLTEPRSSEHGDYTTNIAFRLARELRKSPQEVGESLRDRVMPELTPVVDRIEVVGGFLNLYLRDSALHGIVQDILRFRERFGETNLGRGRRVNLEFVSANPTGPLNVVNARAAAVGDSLTRILRKLGYEADAEYYVNDAGGQIQALGESIAWRLGEIPEPPPDGYLGDYLVSIAEEVHREGIPREEWGTYAAQKILEGQKRTLERFRVHFDRFVHESWIRRSEYPEKVRQKLQPYLEERDGAIFFRSDLFGDEKPRVVVRESGEPTYFFFDLAYHLYKIERGYTDLVDFWGPDHHGYVPRMEAGLKALGFDGNFPVVIVQQVSLLREGKPVRMSKRRGEYFTMDELLDQVGVDAARFFFLLRTVRSPLNFDLTLAQKLTTENPVYYVQYLHARICSLEEYAREQGVTPDPAQLPRLTLPEERDLMRKLLYFPDVLEEIARILDPHPLPVYLMELADLFHGYYQRHRIVTEDPALSSARLTLALAIRQVVKNGLDLIGVSAPERM